MASFTPVGVELIARGVSQMERSLDSIQFGVMDVVSAVDDLTKAYIANADKGAAKFNKEMDTTEKKTTTFGQKLSGMVVKGVKSFGGNLLSVINTASNFTTAIVTATSKVISFGVSVVKNAVGGLISLGQKLYSIGAGAVGAATQFQTAFSGVQKTVNGLDEMVEGLGITWETHLEQQFRDMAKEAPIAIEELLKIGELGGQLGVAKEDLLGFTRTIADLGVSTNLTTEMAASGMAQIANIMGSSTSDIANMGAAMVALGNNSATTESQIMNFALRISGAGKLANLSESDIFALGAAMSSVGVTAEAGGTAVQKVLLEIQEQVAGTSQEFVDNTQAIGKTQQSLQDLSNNLNLAKMRYADLSESASESTRTAAKMRIDKITRQIQEQEQALAGLVAGHGQLAEGENKLAQFAAVAGMKVDEFKELWQTDAKEAFTLFVEGLGASGDQAIGILGELGLEDQRLVRSFLSLGNAGNLLRNSFELSSTAYAENAALTEEASKKYQTFASQMQLVKSQVKDMTITAGKYLMPFLEQGMTKLRPFIEEFAGRLPKMMERYVVPVLENVFDTATGVFDLFAGGFKTGGLKGGIQAVIEGVIPEDVLTRIYGFIDTAKDVVTWLQVNVPSAIQTARDYFTGVLLPGIQTAWNWIQTTAIPVLSTLWEWLQGRLALAVQVLGDYWTLYLQPAFASLWNQWETNLKPAFTELWTYLKTYIPEGTDRMANIWENVLRPALQFIGNILANVIIPVLGEVAAFLIRNIPVALETAKNFWDNVLYPALEKSYNFIKDNVLIIFEALKKFFQETLPGAIGTVQQWIEENLLPPLQAVWAYIDEYVIPVFESLAELFDVALSLAITAIAGVWENLLLPALTTIYEYTVENVMKAFNDLKELFDIGLSAATSGLTTIWETQLKPALEAVWEFIDKNLRPVLEWLQGFLGEKLAEAVEKLTTKFTTWKELIDKVINKLREAGDSLPDWITPGSPTPLEKGVRGITLAMKELGNVSSPIVRQVESGVVSGRPEQNVNLNIGPNTISNGMDQAVFENRVLNTVTDAIG